MEDRIYITIAKILDGEATAADRQELDAWLGEDPAHAVMYEELRQLWGRTDDLFAGPPFDAAAAWDQVAPKLQPADVAPTPARGRVVQLPAWLRTGLAAAAVLLLGVLAYRIWDGRETVVTAAAGNEAVTLPDESVVTLKQGSTLRYPKHFSRTVRAVSLEGEAFFEVTRNPEQPFVIDARSVAVRVLGTSFNVAASDTAATVVVATGKVQVTDRQSDQQLVLTPGRKGTLSAGQLREGAVQDRNYLFWKTGELTFDQIPLNEVTAALTAAKDTLVRLQLPPDQERQLVTISFRGQRLEEMLAELCLITRCAWRKEGAGYLIYKQ